MFSVEPVGRDADRRRGFTPFRHTPDLAAVDSAEEFSRAISLSKIWPFSGIGDKKLIEFYNGVHSITNRSEMKCCFEMAFLQTV